MHIDLTLTGLTPLAMHNTRLADPDDPFTRAIKELTDKRKKTDADYAEIARLEWHGGLYYTPELGVYLPTWNLVRCLERAATISRQGTTLVRALAVTAEAAPLQYDGPREPEALWALPAHRWRTNVGVGQRRVLRMRPLFPRWSVQLDAELLDDVLSADDLRRIADLAGQAEGLGDGRKLGRGRFTAQLRTTA